MHLKPKIDLSTQKLTSNIQFLFKFYYKPNEIFKKEFAIKVL